MTDARIPTPSDASDETGYSANGEYLTVRVGGSSHTRTIREWHELAVASFVRSEREASLSKALDLLQACRMCDLVYDWNDRAVGDFPGSEGKGVHEVVEEFLKEHGRE